MTTARHRRARLFALALPAAACATLAVGLAREHAPERDAGALVLAHRGASGYLPEHTLEAYALAYALGADMIEPDVVLTKDGVLLCAHDLVMDDVTDVAQRFPGRAREDGKHYWIDFTLAEVKTLAKSGRRSPADTPDAAGYQVATLDEMLAMVQRLNATLGVRSGRVVGVIPEPKSPAFHAEHGWDIGRSLADALAARGYRSAEDPAVIQCFDLAALEALHAGGCRLRLLWTLSEEPSEAELERAARVCFGIGPRRTLLEDDAGRPKPLLARARARGLAVYTWTFKDEPEATRRFYREHGVDALFSDYTDVAVRARGG